MTESYIKRDESVIIRPMGGGDFHALVGDGNIPNGADRTRAVYEMIEADEPIHGTWIDYRGNESNPTHTTILHFAGRHAVMWIKA
jgi:hypothetical protein